MHKYLLKLLRYRVDSIILLDGVLHTKPYDVNKPEPSFEFEGVANDN